MKADYVLTTFSPAMFGEGATAHIRIITTEEARKLVGPSTRVVATRPSHERLARNQFEPMAEETVRYAQLRPGTSAVHLHYRGPQVPDSGDMPLGSMITYTLIETEAYQKVRAD